MKCQIADYIINFKNEDTFFEKFCKDYGTDISETAFSVETCDKLIEHERSIDTKNRSTGFYETVSLFRIFASLLPLKNAFVFHSAAFDVDGIGVAFAAHSGTGKSTHMLLWQKLLGERMTVVNGDKPIVRFFCEGENLPDGVQVGMPYVYGTPWRGKELLGCNMRTPLKHICFIERSKTNYVTKIDKADAIDRIFNQVYMPKDSQAVFATMQLIDKMLSSCHLWNIHCNMEEDAASTSYNAIFGNNVAK